MSLSRRSLLGSLSLLLPSVARLDAAEAGLLPAADAALAAELDAVVRRLRLTGPVRTRKLAIALMDLSDAERLRYAGVNDREMMYAASLPKIAILLAGFERIREGLLAYTPAVREMFTRLIRYSSNEDASRAVHAVGFEYIARTLRKYRLYDPRENGGLWVGKAYGGPNDYWKRDPLHQISHGATAAQVARFFWLLDRGELVDAQASAEMKRILGDPGIRHKFVKGLADTPGRAIYRKSGTWRNWHADGALVEAGDRRYIAVALMEDPRGGDVLPQLIREFDRIVCGSAPPSFAATPAAAGAI